MNRRQAIIGTFLLGTGSVLTFFGNKAYNIFKEPNFEFLELNKILIDELVETIIPKTDSPGAKDVGVGKFLMMMILECTDRRSQNNFINGLEDLTQDAYSAFNRSFLKCSGEERETLLRNFETELNPNSIWNKVERKVLGEPFISILKKYTALGYCTSEWGAKEGLSYDYIPGRYVGVTSLEPGQKAWATQ